MEELEAIEKNETRVMMELPEGKNETGLKWAFKTKFGAYGCIKNIKLKL